MRFALTLLCCLLPSLLMAQKEFGFDNTKGSGQPYLTPEESLSRMKVHPDFKISLFAAEPMVTNPICYTVDEKGRVWVVESFEYPKRTAKDKMPRDRIVILEDTDGDGKADKRTIFAEGKDFPVRFDMASGIEVAKGNSCYLGAPPYLWHLEDTNSDGKADKFTIVRKGFGSEDTHETLNTFNWGPDGWLYGLHGVFTNSKVATPDSKEPSIDMDAAVWRYHPKLNKFEIYAEGTSNPWGMDFDKNGNCFLCCCVIPHLFHMVPGGVYIKQGGKPSKNPYVYGPMKEICDHTFYKKSGWAHAGLLCLDHPHIPASLQNSVIFGSIHGCSLKRNTLTPKGSTFLGQEAEDFLVSGDKNFRPVNIRWAHDGSFYISDWHDQHPCHQTKPEDWDYDRGRIYRVSLKNQNPTKAPDLLTKKVEELITLAQNSANPWEKRTALRLLHEKGTNQTGERNSKAQFQATDVFVSLATGQITKLMDQWDALPPAARVTLLRNLPDTERVNLLTQVVEWARKETDVTVKREFASLAIRWSDLVTREILLPLLKSEMDKDDAVLGTLLWIAFEKQMAKSNSIINYLAEPRPENTRETLITKHILHRAVRRVASSGKTDDLFAAIHFLQNGKLSSLGVSSGLEGLAEAVKNRQLEAPINWPGLYKQLQLSSVSPRYGQLAKQIAISFADKGVAEKMLEIAKDTSASKDNRLVAMVNLKAARIPASIDPLLAILNKDKDLDLRLAAIHALTEMPQCDLPNKTIGQWKQYPDEVRYALVNAFKTHESWAGVFLGFLEEKRIPRGDVNDGIILHIRNFKRFDDKIQKAWGKFRDSPEDILKLIESKRTELAKLQPDLERGKAVYEKQCAQCHKFEGKGYEVGPMLDGSERSVDYLLTNIIDPNRVVGTPYFAHIIQLKNGKLVTGLLAEEDASTIRLKKEKDQIEVISRKEIEEHTVSTKSLMPEGIVNNITAQELRDLIRYLEKK